MNKAKVYMSLPYLKRYALYFLSIVLLSVGVALIYQTFFGAAAWDALHYNFYIGIPIQFKYLNPISSALLVSIAYLIEWKKPNLVMIIPVILSTVFGVFLDILVIYLPSVKEAFFMWDVLYLVLAITVISIGLNIIRYCDFGLPAIDQFCLAIARRFKLTFGQGKLIGEVIAMISAITVGLIFGTQGEFFYLGFTTVFFILFLGAIIDLFRNSVYRILKGIPHMELFADDITEADINQETVFQTANAIIEKDGLYMVLYLKDRDFYTLPGGKKSDGLSLEKSLKKEILAKTGYKIFIHEEEMILHEYFIDSTYETHYFKAKLRNPKTRLEAIDSKNIEVVWLKKDALLEILSNHETKDKFGPQIMWREFLVIMNMI
jgi:uncharacterized membrane protein YczE